VLRNTVDDLMLKDHYFFTENVDFSLLWADRNDDSITLFPHLDAGDAQMSRSVWKIMRDSLTNWVIGLVLENLSIRLPQCNSQKRHKLSNEVLLALKKEYNGDLLKLFDKQIIYQESNGLYTLNKGTIYTRACTEESKNVIRCILIDYLELIKIDLFNKEFIVCDILSFCAKKLQNFKKKFERSRLK